MNTSSQDVKRMNAALVRLRSLTAPPPGGQHADALTHAELVREVSVYPVEAVERACEELARSSDFFPRLHSLLTAVGEHARLLQVQAPQLEGPPTAEDVAKLVNRALGWVSTATRAAFVEVLRAPGGHEAARTLALYWRPINARLFASHPFQTPNREELQGLEATVISLLPEHVAARLERERAEAMATRPVVEQASVNPFMAVLNHIRGTQMPQLRPLPVVLKPPTDDEVRESARRLGIPRRAS